MATFYLDPVGGADATKDDSNQNLSFILVAGTITSAQQKFGAYSLDTSGSTSNRMSLPGNNGPIYATAFGANPFTIEAWVRWSSTVGANSEVICGHFSGSSNLSWNFLKNASGQLSFSYSTDGTTTTNVAAAFTPTIGQWYHCAVDCDSGGTIRVYLDGAVLASGARSAAIFLSTTTFYVGNDGNANRGLPGQVGGLRITKGVARYAGAFTPPTAAFPTDTAGDSNFDSVTCLLNFNTNGDGQSFANRWRTFTNGATAARIAPGDTIRMIASPAPTSIGNATWTDNSRTVTLATANTAVIDNCDAAWTGSTNVTSTATATNRKQGTNCASLAIATAFTTGKVAYKATGALDLSAYQQVSFWMRASSSTNSGVFRMCLCSDTTGDTVVHSIPIEVAANGSSWRVVAKDFKANLSSSIQSVALYADVDPGILTVLLDNIIACKAASADDSLTHLSLIGKNTVGEPEWYPILSINGTTVELGCGNDAVISSASTTPRNYRGTTETVTTYKLQPLDGVNSCGPNVPLSTSNRPVQDSGTDGSPITFSGGWDRTAMSTQSGETWITGSHWAGSIIELTNRDWIVVDKVGAAHCITEAFGHNSACDNLNITLVGVVGCNAILLGSAALSNNLVLDFGNAVANGTSTSNTSLILTGVAGIVRGRRMTGSMGNAVNVGAPMGRTLRMYIDQIDNSNNGASFSQSANTAGKTIWYDLTMTNNGSSDMIVNGGGDQTFINANLSTAVFNTSSSPGDQFKFQNYGGVATDHRLYAGGWNVLSDTTTRHTASGFSWKVSPFNSTVVTSVTPAVLPLGKRLVQSGVSATFGVWVRRDQSAMTVGIRVIGGNVAGVADTQATMTAAINTWEQVTVTVTPTEDGVVEVEGFCYGSTLGSAWFDDYSVS